MRDDYLEWIEKDQNEDRRIYYQDKTWVFKNMACNKVWKYILRREIDDRFKVLLRKGERSILSHIGCAITGLLDLCMFLFRGSKSNKSVDYRVEMNCAVFSKWCEKKVFTDIAGTGIKSVVVLDRATYHNVLDEEDRKPAASWNKALSIEAMKQ